MHFLLFMLYSVILAAGQIIIATLTVEECKESQLQAVWHWQPNPRKEMSTLACNNR